MNSRLKFLLVILGISILVFLWGTTDYLRCYTDTPDPNSFNLCPVPNIHGTSAFIATLVIIGIIPILTWMKIKNFRLRIIFTALSGVGIFFTFVGVIQLILILRS